MTAQVEIRLLGPLSVVIDGNEVSVGGRKQRTLLGLLALNSPAEVSTDRCLEAIWGDDVSETSVHTLHTYVSNLRRLFDRTDEVAVERTADGYRLLTTSEVIDLTRFRSRVRTAEQEDDPEAKAAALHSALALWQGSPLGDLGSEGWAQIEVNELTESKRLATTNRIDVDLRLGRHRSLVVELEGLVAEHPYREDLWARLVLALYRSGRQADALAACRRARALLADELGIEPGPELTDLEDRVLLHDPSLDLSQSPDTASLPHPRGDLVGRGELVERIVGLTGTERIVTLVGPGGVGKTSVGVVAAHALKSKMDGVWFCDLVPVSEPDAVPMAVADSLGLHVNERALAPERIARWIGGQSAVLILDNCEHVLSGVAGFVTAVVDRCESLTVLATSREPISVRGERVVEIPTLETAAAVDLIRRSAHTVAAFPELHRLEELSERLDGLPLALELAAARLSHMTVDEVLDRLDHRFRLLTGGPDENPRHSALETTIDWSYRLLSDDEQAMLRAVAVFAEGFDLEGATAVWNGDEFEALDLIGSLVSKSLLVAERHEKTTRYRLLETVRAFARARLDDAGETEARTGLHAEFHFRQAAATPPHPPDDHPWAHLLEADLTRSVALADSVLALDWLAAHDRLLDAAKLHARMLALDHRRHLDPHRRVMERHDVARALDDDAERALYCVAAALQANMLGRWDSTYDFSLQALDLDADPHTTAIAAGLAAQVATWREPDRVEELLERGQSRLPSDSTELAAFLAERRADALFAQGRVGEAATLLQELDDRGSSWAAFELCIAFHLNENDALVDAHIDSLSEAERSSTFRYRLHLARALAAIAREDPGEALRRLDAAAREALRHPGELFDRDVLVGCAALANLQGDHVRAAELLATVGATTRTPASIVLYRRYRDLTRAALDRDAVEGARERMRGRDPAQVLTTELRRLQSQAVRTRT